MTQFGKLQLATIWQKHEGSQDLVSKLNNPELIFTAVPVVKRGLKISCILAVSGHSSLLLVDHKILPLYMTLCVLVKFK